MGVISEAYAMRRVIEYLNSPAGKSKLAEQGKKISSQQVNMSRSVSKERAMEITHSICEKFKNIVFKTIKSFRLNAIHAEIDGTDTHGCLRANISVDKDALRRESLHYMNKDRSIAHGDGVEDILALFTHGYTLNKRPYGFWVRDTGASMTRIGARAVNRTPATA